ncbi:hypothetical protein BDN72DRAFT_847600 [Pluteus cervinus]|uniref:Uncharacterized protein n=1 Tax=Pluteus cervinus TaxID=181527 RepID=A0ACD3ACH9_9AGAR|nr:hypothetical protein BDN72DRAFT_847600 [Pluteus cervinus]
MAPTHPILRQHFDTSEIAFAKIDHEIAIFQEGIRALRAFRNTFTPVYRLPPEILARVFSFFQGFLNSEKDYYGKVTFKWLTVTRISQHWRNIAIGSPGLWSHISSGYPERIFNLWVQRSKAAPLFVQLSHASSQDAHIITTSLSRIQELKLTVNSMMWNDFWSNLSSPAPLLEYLAINIVETGEPLAILSDRTFAGMTPHLRCLELDSGCSLDINSSFFKDVTVFKLHDPSQRMTITDLFTVIRKLPLLTSLTLDNVLQNDIAPVSNRHDVIDLPHLKYLSIIGESLAPDLCLLSHLSFSSNTTLVFGSEAMTEDPVSALSDFLRVQKAARHPDSPPSPSISINLHWISNIVRLSITIDGAEPVVDFLQFKLIGPRVGPLEIPDNPTIVALFSSLPLPSLSSFTTSCDIDVGIWANVLGPLPKLERISASGSQAVNMLSAITDDFKGGLPTTGTQTVQPIGWVPIFPQLEEIEVCDTTFPESITDLVGALGTRRDVGKGIKTFTVKECLNVDRATVDQLSSCVSNLVWDGWRPRQTSQRQYVYKDDSSDSDYDD